METETAFVCTKSGVVLHAITEVGLDFAIAVNPSHTESEDTIGLNQALDDLSFLKFRMLVVNFFDGFENFLNRLQILIFTRMFGFQVSHDFFNFHNITFLSC